MGHSAGIICSTDPKATKHVWCKIVPPANFGPVQTFHGDEKAG